MYEINKNGLTLPTYQEIINFLEENFKNIYGFDLDFSQNTPDGQLINIFSQNQVDVNELILDLYNNLFIQFAEGVNLDNLVSNHLIKRNGGSYTILPVEIETSQPVQLRGLDNGNIDSSSVFSIEDNIGNQFFLMSSININDEGKTTALFRAKNIGAVEISLNTLKNIITPQVGVISVNNPFNEISIGKEEEIDEDLRERYFKTFANGGVGGFDNIVSALYNVEGVLEVGGENNNTNITSTAGTPPHSVWLIVLGGEGEKIADTIYSILNAGCGMRGETIINKVGKQGQVFTIKFDRPSFENIFIKFSILKKNNNYNYDVDYIILK